MSDQLMAAFGPDVYVSCPNIARMRAAMQHEQPSPTSSLASIDSTLITVLDESLLVTDMDASAKQRIGQVVGRSLVSADWVLWAVRMLADWAPYSCELDAVSSDGAPSKIVCTLYPFFDDSVAGENAPSAGTRHTPNRVLWTMRECPSVSNEMQIATMIRFVVKRAVKTAQTRISSVDPGSCQNAVSVLRLASDLFDDIAISASSSEATDVGTLVDLMVSFLKWVSAIEGSLWNLHQIEMLEACNEHPSVLSSNFFSLDNDVGMSTAPMQHPLSHPQHANFTPLEREYFKHAADPVQSVYNTTDDLLKRKHIKSDNIDMSTLADMSSSVDTFFSQLRDPAICPHIVGLLRKVPSAEASVVVEDFITHTQTKHSNPKVQILMRDAQEMIRTQKLEEAINVLDEVRCIHTWIYVVGSWRSLIPLCVLVQIIALDVDFVEAYNRRATANYGLRRAQECYADLEQVLSRNPLHFGALCGKVSMDHQ